MNSNRSDFVQGLDLSESFYRQIVQPILARRLPQLKYACALIGAGSEVLGFDTEMSSDHDWGPRLLLFVESENLVKNGREINTVLQQELPVEFRGFPTQYALSKPDADGQNFIQHRVDVFSVASFLKDYLGFDYAQTIKSVDWLTFPEQKLRSITAGRVFRDEVKLHEMRQQFAYYPDNVWLYLLASGWNRIEQEEHLMGRAGLVGDEIGSSLIAARLVRDLMRLCFLMEKAYAPYAKWFGTAFTKLSCSKELAPVLEQILQASTWKNREKYLSHAYKFVAAMHNKLKITETLSEDVAQFHGRPFWTISMGAFSQAIAAKITEPEMKKLAQKRLIGGIDQISDNTDILEDANRRLLFKDFYGLD
ncbi:MAG: DUF4037 domain-containing protein [Candidatus Obscuribacterales bacterium]|nr:DUF4037 domain-containing protein [Candidatus Obscuribacterales bacterium]